MQGLVGRVQGISQLHRHSLQKPLPVAQMRGHEHHRLARVQVFTCRAQIENAHVLRHVGGGHGCRFQHLHHDVAEVVEKALVNGDSLRRARVRKDLRDLLADDPVPMPNDVIRQEVQKGGKRVQRPHGQARQEFDHRQILLQAAWTPARGGGTPTHRGRHEKGTLWARRRC